ncbi:hypothetical protein LXL04_028719 [Taraxacum kok-saghyz]
MEKTVVSIHNLKKKPVSYIARKASNGVWCNIQKAVKYLGEINVEWHDHFKLIPDADSEFLFWKDEWCGDIPFHHKIPELFKLEKKKNYGLTDRFTAEGFSWEWKKEPRDPIVLPELLHLYNEIGNMEVEKKPKWRFAFTETVNGDYVVNKMRRIIDAKLIHSKGPTICWNNIIPLKVRCFVWRTMMRRIPVADTLACRGIIVQNSLCHLCGSDVETVDHLFASCSYTSSVMVWIFKWCNIQPPQFHNVGDILNYAATWGNCPRKRTVLISILYCSF